MSEPAQDVDLDLGFNDFLDVSLKLSRVSSGPVSFAYKTKKTVALAGPKSFEIPAKLLLRDGKWHVYRVDLGLEKLWRGALAGLSVAPLKTADTMLGKVTIGDTEKGLYIPNYKTIAKTDYELFSKHFRFIWNAERAKAGMNAEWAKGNLRNAEECWQLFMTGFGMREPVDKDKTGKKFLINFTCTEQGFWAGGDQFNIDPSGLKVDPPSWVIPHEFRHRCQFYSQASGAPENMYEADPNYTRECWLWYYGPTYDPTGPKSSNEYTKLLNFCIPHSRTYYICWPYLIYMYENPDKLKGLGGQFWWRVWAEGKRGENQWDTIHRLAPDVSIKDLLGYVARRRSYAFEHRLKAEISERTELKRCPDAPEWWQVPSEMAPMQAGYAIHELTPTANKVTVELAGIANKERGTDWRASLVVMNDKGAERYSPLWSKGKQTVTLKPNEKRVILVVAGTPDKMINSSFDDPASPYRTAPGKARMPYRVRVIGATPKESAPALRGAFHTHPNGGGRVSDTATVDATAFVGPNAVVAANAQVRGNARIEDFALVTDTSQVLDDAIVSGHAVVAGKSVVSGNAKVRDYADIRDSKVSGYARALEHAVIRTNAVLKDYATAKGRCESWGEGGSSVGGDGVIDGDFCGGQTVKNGFQYGHMPYEGNPWVGKRTAPERLLAAFEFDKPSESFAKDAYGTSDGFLGGKPSWVAQDDSRKGVLKLSGKDYIVLDRQLVDLAEFTFSAWVKWDGGAANQALLAFGADKDANMTLTPDDGQGHVRFIARLGRLSQTLVSSVALPKGKWVHIAVTAQGLYLDGKKVGEGTITLRPDQVLPANTNAALQHVYLGKGLAPSQSGFVGSVDGLRFYTKTLSDAEIEALAVK
jgi:hypothetical protein